MDMQACEGEPGVRSADHEQDSGVHNAYHAIADHEQVPIFFRWRRLVPVLLFVCFGLAVLGAEVSKSFDGTIANLQVTSAAAHPRRVESTLPAGWTAEVDPKSNMTYYINEKTKTGTFVRPQFDCSRSTGGTCFFAGCDAALRGDSVVCEIDSLGLPMPNFVPSFLKFGWRSCNCRDPAPCASAEGVCQAPGTGDVSGGVLVLQESCGWIILCAIIPVLRSGMLAVIQSKLGFDKATGNKQNVPTRYDHMYEWKDLMKELKLTVAQAYSVMSAKAVFLHHAQVLLFMMPYFAYRNFMGFWQSMFASIVLAKELWYFAITWVGISMNPAFLLFTPFTEKKRDYVVQYVADPEVFIAQSIAGAAAGAS